MSDRWKNKKILLTGGTGSFGKAFTNYVLKHRRPNVLRIFSRDELKQFEMAQQFDDPAVRFFIGDIRDRERLDRAMRGVDIVVHAAAMKQVVACEYNPFEAVKTNIIGTQNVIDIAINCSVSNLISISTDKAVNPVNLYGATKLCQERIVIQSNAYVGPKKTRLSCVRYGNVVGSRGSVVPVFMEQKKNGELTVTDKEMTRFWISLPQAVKFVVSCIDRMVGGEIFVPKIPSMKIMDLAQAIAPEAMVKIVGIRPGEKVHEVLLTSEESRHTLDVGDRYIIEPELSWWDRGHHVGKKLKEGFFYSSERNTRWLSESELAEILEESRPQKSTLKSRKAV